MTVRGDMPLLWGPVQTALRLPQQEQSEQQEQQQRISCRAVHAYQLSLPEICSGATFCIEGRDKRLDGFLAAPGVT